jgi:MFS family permease
MTLLESSIAMETEADNRLWIRQLSTSERSAFIATFAGWMLDGMDVMVYSLILPVLLTLWHISKGQAGLLSTSTLLLSSLGGWLAGIFADRFGRVRMLKITIFWFAFFTFLSGFTQNFEQLLVVRGLQGLGFGGEWAVGATLMGETIRARFRGRAVGTVQAGWSIGWGISVVCFTAAFTLLPHATAWRVMFWIGILPALLIFYIRRKVEEPEIYTRTIRTGKSDFLAIFSPELLRTTAFASIVALGAQGGYHAVTTWLPLYLADARGLPMINTGGYLIVITGGAFVGYLTAAHLADAIGRKRTLVLFAICAFLTVLVYTAVPISNRTALALGFFLGFFPSGAFSPMGAFFSELFPTTMRATGCGFVYNFGRGVGALFPALVGYVSAHRSLGAAIAIFGSGAYLIMIAGALFLPETRGRQLES